MVVNHLAVTRLFAAGAGAAVVQLDRVRRRLETLGGELEELRRASRAASITALPITVVERLEPVERSNGVKSVSMARTVTRIERYG
jgi:hypothetical protein